MLDEEIPAVETKMETTRTMACATGKPRTMISVVTLQTSTADPMVDVLALLQNLFVEQRAIIRRQLSKFVSIAPIFSAFLFQNDGVRQRKVV